MANKTELLTIRIEPDTFKHLRIESHLIKMSMSRLVLQSTFSTLVDINNRTAEIYQRMAEDTPPGEKKNELERLCRDARDCAAYWTERYETAGELDQTYKEIESVTAYKDLLLQEVN